MLATLCLILFTGCTVEVKPQILPNVRLPWQQPPPKPWWKPGVQVISLRKPKLPAEAPAVAPEHKPALHASAIHHDGPRQYILRRGQRCYWSAVHGAWREPIRGSCAGGICGYRNIKPGQ